MKTERKALVVFSGGQDSTTCLGWALNRYKEVIALTFIYGQKHRVEVGVAIDICEKLKIQQMVVDFSFFGGLVESALTSNGDVGKRHIDAPLLPASFVPNRNALFLTLAHAHAQKIKADDIVTGVCQTDYSGYPDCRYVFIKRMQDVLNMGSDSVISILTPLMYLDKAQIFKLAEIEGILDLVVVNSHTCYNGKRGGDNSHEWGYGCGDCPACKLRKKGWEEYSKGR